MESSSDSEINIPINIRRRRIFKTRINNDFNDLYDYQFKEKFRVGKATAEYIILKIGDGLEHQTRRNNALDPTSQLLCALHWFGCGAQYHVIGDGQGVSKSTIHRCVKRVCLLIVERLLGEEVRWPAENVASIPQQFMRFANIPSIAGIVDGSLVEIDAPTENELAFVDRNGNHSINAMFVCGPNLDFFYVSARWPGSVHDARVLRNSSLRTRWENGWRPFPGAIILGDSGYGRNEWLIPSVVPHQIERSNALRRFLIAHKKTRRLIECSLGILKEKFPCLNYMRLSPNVACSVILTCTVLHNLEKRMGSSSYDPYELIVDSNDDESLLENLMDQNFEDIDVPNAHNRDESLRILRNLILRFA